MCFVSCKQEIMCIVYQKHIMYYVYCIQETQQVCFIICDGLCASYTRYILARTGQVCIECVMCIVHTRSYTTFYKQLYICIHSNINN